MKRYLLAACALAYAAFLAWGCASVHESMRNVVVRDWEACDEGLTMAEVDSIYFGGTER